MRVSTYSEVLTSDRVISVFETPPNTTDGGTAFRNYLKNHLPGKVWFDLMSDFGGDKKGFDKLPFEYVSTITRREKGHSLTWINDEAYKWDLNLPFDFIVHSPVYFATMDYVDGVNDYLTRARNSLMVLHDAYYTYDGEWLQTKDLVGQWAGTLVAKSLDDRREVFLALCRKVNYLICPSEFIYNAYRSWFVEIGYETGTHKLIMIPNPHYEVNRHYRLSIELKHKQREKHNNEILLGPLHKQDLEIVVPLVKWCNANEITLVVPYSESMSDLHWQWGKLFTKPYVRIEMGVAQPNLYHLMQSIPVLVDGTMFAESFGYMVREAMFFGQKVMARPLGALAELEGNELFNPYEDWTDLVELLNTHFGKKD